MASGGGSGFSYRPNVNRNVTKKWKEASRPTYDDDDDWGDDGYGTYDQPPPMPAPGSRPGWGGQMPPPNRSFTNPSPPRSTGRQSFDRGDDRRYVSAGSGFESAYPSTQRSPFPEPRHDEPPPQRFYAQQHPPQLNTQGQGPFQPPSFRPSSRGSQRSGYGDVPFSAPGAYGQQRSHSGNRPGPGGFSQRQGSPARPDSRSSNHSNRFMPPRKSSLGQDQSQLPNFSPVPPVPLPPVDDLSNVGAPSTAPAKPLPFIRPSDIYKRMEEEKERERQSLDSSRPSLELDTARSRDSASTSRFTPSESRDVAPGEGDSDSMRRLRTTLDPVPERKSEYGFDNLSKTAPAPQVESVQQNDGVHRNDTTASSVYTDRPDPVSASTDDKDDEEPTSAFSYEPSQSSFRRDADLAPQRTVAAPHDHDQVSNVASAGKLEDVTSSDSNLDHKPSLGYRSVVHQAFDDSQKDGPTSPTSNVDTIPRSNSASTSELSPIIGRKPDHPASFGTNTMTEPSIPEEPLSAGANRPLSDATIKGSDGGLLDQAAVAPPNVQPGYRREGTPPSSGSPARRADLRTSDEVQPHHGMLARSGTAESLAEEQAVSRGREQPVPGVLSPSASQASGVSEEFNRWQAQSSQFNQSHGLIDSNPNLNSPVSRAESPPKGTVRDLAGKYDNNSGRSTPVSAIYGETEVSRPSQARLESFRPVIPGGWQSYTATPGVHTPQQEAPPLSVRPSEQRFDSTDSIPTAKAPRGNHSGLSNEAFAAAAAAGTALAGSFSGPAMSGRRDDMSDDESENEWDQSSTSSKEQAPTHEVRDFAATPGSQPHIQSLHASKGVAHSDAATPSDITGKDTPSESGAGQSTLDYFPAPLRTSRSLEPGVTARQAATNRSSFEDHGEHGNDEELQQQIVKSLTPRSSNFDAPPRDDAQHQTLPATTFGARAPSAPWHESDDMYSGRSEQHTPPIETPVKTIQPVSHQPQFSVSSIGSSPHRPFLEQRFSWEMEKDQPTAASAAAPVVTTVEDNVATRRPSTPPVMRSATAQSPETPRVATLSSPTDQDIANTPGSRPTSSGDAKEPPLGRTSTSYGDTPQKPLPVTLAPGMAQPKAFQTIMKMGNQQDRIKAFDDNRIAYGQSDGQLDQWIQSMQAPEHADIFSSNGRIWKDAGSTGDRSGPQRVPSSRPIGNISGARVMQEDGKKLMAAAGRFGGKAGIAAKGLFAKSKDKFRAASASEKGSTNRRQSTGPLPTIIDDETSNMPGDSAASSQWQLPAHEPVISPLDESKWFGFDREGNTNGPAQNLDKDRSDVDGGIAAPATAAASVGGAALIASKLSTEQETRRSTSYEAENAEPVDRAFVKDGEDQLKRDQTNPDLSSANTHHRRVSDLRADEMEPSTGHARLQPSQMLAVEAGRRNSSVSAVSSPSPSPAVSNNELANRSISPAVTAEERTAPAPLYNETEPQTISKEEEAAQERVAAADNNDPVPQYEAIADTHGRQPQIGPDAQILPVADLGARQRTDPVVSSRPFSFEGSEALRQAQQAYVQDQQPQDTISQPLSPVSQTASKTLSQVSVEEAVDERALKPNRVSKSYSRPFGTESLGQHPAFRQDEQQHSASQLGSSQVPTGDVHRLEAEGARYRDQLRPTQEQGYRIPGPYHQEYRSPKPKSTQTPSPTAPQNQRANNLPSVNQQVTMPPASFEDFGDKRFPGASGAGSMGPPPLPPPVHDQPRPAPPPSKRSFGAFFRAKSKPAPGRRESIDREDVVDGGKRPGFFSRNSRQDSIASQNSSQNESRDMVGQLPSATVANRKQNRLSKDFTGRKTPTQLESDDPSNKKKKRFSAMGNLFSKSDKNERVATPQRSSTLPYNSVQPDRGQYQQQYQDDRSQQYPYSAPVGGYPPQQEPQQYNYNEHPSQNESYSQHYPTPATNYNQQHHDSRPSDLRIDTSGHGGRRINHPATAPPQTYAPRDISYDGTTSNHNTAVSAFPSHNPNSTSTTFYHPTTATSPIPPPTTRAPTSAAPSSATRPSTIDAHVVQLHKRSRSPTSEARRRSQGGSLAPPVPEEDIDPAGGLGTFSNKKYSPVDGVVRSEGEQEKPWRIGIPGSDGEEGRRRTKQLVIEQGGRMRDVGHGSAVDGTQQQQQQTVAERMMAPSMPASASTVNGHAHANGASGITKPPPIPAMSPNRDAIGSRDGRRGGYVAELPGSKAEGYESEEEITMSATAFPGDWQMPVFVDDAR